MRNAEKIEITMTAATDISTADLIEDAAWFPHRLDLTRRVVLFGRFERDALSRASFLDYRIEDAAQRWAEASLDELLGAVSRTRSAKPAFLFHTSYCCSTLLARALDRPGRVLALKEPEIIMGLSNAYRMAQSQEEIENIHELRDILLALLARPREDGERVLIKPTNAANNLIPILAALDSPITLLYGDLRGFLASVIKKGDPCKTLVRQIYRVYAMDNIGVSAIPQRDALALTDLQIAALVWRHQMELFNTVLSAATTAHVRSLEFHQLLANPAATLHATSNHFTFGLSPEDCLAIASGSLFRQDAKDDTRSYDAVKRAEEERVLIEQNAEALDMIETWAFQLSLWPARTKQLPKALTN
jgi:hypothetical protein